MTRIALHTLARAATVALLADYAASAGVKLQVYPGRPLSILPPTAFIDLLREQITYTGLHERVVTAEAIVIHGLFDPKEAVDQKDAFVDGFLDWSFDRYHATDPNTTLAVAEIEDVPDYVPDWIAPESGRQRTYYATRIAVEARAAEG